MFPLITEEELKKQLPLIRQEGVSKRARRKDGFLSVYLRDGFSGLSKPYPGKEHSYLVERENFIKRHMAQFLISPSLRRYLALVAWAYKPEVRMDRL
jgi:hypothetical protein